MRVSIYLRHARARKGKSGLRDSACNVPTAFSSIMPWAFVFAADIAAGLGALLKKKRRRNEMVGNLAILRSRESSEDVRGKEKWGRASSCGTIYMVSLICAGVRGSDANMQ